MTPIIGSSSVTPTAAVGPRGPTGDEVVGPTGATGLTGSTGATGATGIYIFSGDNTTEHPNLILTLSDGTELTVSNFIGPTGSIGFADGVTTNGYVPILKEVSSGLTFWFKGISADGSLSLYTTDDLIVVTGGIQYQESAADGISYANRFVYLSGNNTVSNSGLTFDGSMGIDFNNSVTVDIEENIIVIPEIDFNHEVGITGAPCDGTCPGGTAGNGTGIQLEVRYGSVIKVHTPTGIAGFTGEFINRETFGFTMILDGNYIWAWPENIYFKEDNAIFSCGEDIINFMTDDGGATWNATVSSIGYNADPDTCDGTSSLGSCCYVDDYGKKQCIEYVTELACNENYNQSQWSALSPCEENCGFTAGGVCCSHGGNWGDFAGTGICIEGTGVAECNYFGGTFWDYFYYEEDENGFAIELDTPIPINCGTVADGNSLYNTLCPSPCDVISCCKDGVCIGDSVGSTSVGMISPVSCKYVFGGIPIEGNLCGEIDCCNYTRIEGACCYQEIQQCVYQPAYSCAESGGIFMGPGTDCDGDVCCFYDEVGVCCLNADACDCCGGITKGCCACVAGSSIQSEMDCTANTDYCVYLGDNTTCPDVISGACCHIDQGAWQCYEKNINECAGLEGSLLVDEDCSNVDCSALLLGACCLGGGCIGYKTPDECTTLNGEWMGVDTTCVDPDLCVIEPCNCWDGCFESFPPDNMCPSWCVLTGNDECNDVFDISGACCEFELDQGNWIPAGCANTNMNACNSCALCGHNVFHPGKQCGELDGEISCSMEDISGACCNGDNDDGCTENERRVDCNQMIWGATWMGPGSVCGSVNCDGVAPMAPCCHPSFEGNCGLTNQGTCNNMGGDWKPEASDCEEANCLAGGGGAFAPPAGMTRLCCCEPAGGWGVCDDSPELCVCHELTQDECGIPGGCAVRCGCYEAGNCPPAEPCYVYQTSMSLTCNNGLCPDTMIPDTEEEHICCLSTGCEMLTQAECIYCTQSGDNCGVSYANFDYPSEMNCESNPNPCTDIPWGCCNQELNECTMLSAWSCAVGWASSGASWWYGSDCCDVHDETQVGPCSAVSTGVCCNVDGADSQCHDVSTSDCCGTVGTFVSAGTVCDCDTCPNCTTCGDDNSDCTSGGGGALGACCGNHNSLGACLPMSEGGCHCLGDNISYEDCTALSGNWVEFDADGNQATCTYLTTTECRTYFEGACCYAPTNCWNFNQWDCEDYAGGIFEWTGGTTWPYAQCVDSSTCPEPADDPVGACCTCSGAMETCCDDNNGKGHTDAECIALGSPGVPQGEGTTCAGTNRCEGDTGTCCGTTSQYSCALETVPDCDALGGTWMSEVPGDCTAGNSCEYVAVYGACCNTEDGLCYSVDSNLCTGTNMDGLSYYQGDNITCNISICYGFALGACCADPLGSGCTDQTNGIATTETTCEGSGGTWGGAGSLCSSGVCDEVVSNICCWCSGNNHHCDDSFDQTTCEQSLNGYFTTGTCGDGTCANWNGTGSCCTTSMGMWSCNVETRCECDIGGDEFDLGGTCANCNQNESCCGEPNPQTLCCCPTGECSILPSGQVADCQTYCVDWTNLTYTIGDFTSDCSTNPCNQPEPDTQVCCCESGTCMGPVETLAECNESTNCNGTGSLHGGNDDDCNTVDICPQPAELDGACCCAAMGCFVTDRDTCTSECPEFAPYFVPRLTCAEVNCFSGNGDSACPCADKTGKCCFSCIHDSGDWNLPPDVDGGIQKGCLHELTRIECEDMGGKYMGDCEVGVDPCEDDDCCKCNKDVDGSSEPTCVGACCYSGICVDDNCENCHAFSMGVDCPYINTNDPHDNFGCHYLGDGTSCASTNDCNDDVTCCFEDGYQGFWYDPSGDHWSSNPADHPEVFCDVGDNCCGNADGSDGGFSAWECALNAGIIMNGISSCGGTLCDEYDNPSRACCKNGACHHVTFDVCMNLAGVWNANVDVDTPVFCPGNGDNPVDGENPCVNDDVVACCHDGQCTMASIIECLHVHHGTIENGLCVQNDCSKQACCMGDNSCRWITEGECYGQGGEPQGAGNYCWEVSCGGVCKPVDIMFLLSSHYTMAGVDCENAWGAYSNIPHHEPFTGGGDDNGDRGDWEENCFGLPTCNDDPIGDEPWGPCVGDDNDCECPHEGRCAWMDPAIEDPTNLRIAQNAILNMLENTRPVDKIGFLSYGWGHHGVIGGHCNGWNSLDVHNDIDSTHYGEEYTYGHYDPLTCGGAGGTYPWDTWDCYGCEHESCMPLYQHPSFSSSWCNGACQYAPLSFNRESVKFRVNNVTPMSSSWLVLAQDDMIREFTHNGRPKEDTERVLIIINDGNDSDWFLSAAFLADELKLEHNVETFVIGIGDHIGDGIPYGVSDIPGYNGRHWDDEENDGKSPGNPECVGEPTGPYCGDSGGGSDCCVGAECTSTIDPEDCECPQGVNCSWGAKTAIGKCPWPPWHEHNCHGYYMRKLASDLNHFYTIDNYEELSEKLNGIYSSYCDTGFRCCKNLNQPMCSRIGGEWQPGWCQNEGTQCKNFGTRVCGTSPLCGNDMFVGACCIQGPIDSICMNDMTQDACIDSGGDYRGVGSYCATENCGGIAEPTGACCQTDGGCYPARAAQCVTNGGIWDGSPSCEDVYCCSTEDDNDPSACCYWDDANSEIKCVYVAECLCKQMGGQRYGGSDASFIQCENVTCENEYLGACCDGDPYNPQCTETLIGDCNEPSEWYGNPSCDDVCCDNGVTGRCCVGTNCSMKTKCVCDEYEGVWYECPPEGDCCTPSICAEGLIGGEGLKYVWIEDEFGRLTCDLIWCSIYNCPYPECEPED